MTDGLDSRVLLEPTDGSLGPLLRLTEDRLQPGAGYGTHTHADVDVVAVLLSGSVAHSWGDRLTLRAGDVGVLRAGSGLDHDEVAGADGAQLLQTHLRAAAPGAAPHHHAVRWSAARPHGWVDLGRPDAALWLARLVPGERVDPPAGLRVLATAQGVRVVPGAGPVTGPAVVAVWQLDTGRPAWARS